MESEVYIRHIKNEANHWWFKGRREILSSIIKKEISTKETNIKILDFGAGSGTNIEMLLNYGEVFVYEKDDKTFNFLKEKFKNTPNVQVLDSLNKNILFDFILAADVIEHIENDEKIIKFFSNLLNPNGKILISVPAFKFLFSEKDKALKHFRRYNMSELENLVSKYFKITKLSYFNFLLFIPIALSIIILKIFRIKFIDYVEKTPNFIVNHIMHIVFSTEKHFINLMNFPFGISIVLLGVKNK